jgi:peptide/nickel transport system ATP-binding protein
MMFISHDLGVVRHLCQRIAVMYLGRIVEQGPSDEIFRRPRHPYTQTLLAAIPHLDADASAPVVVALGEPPSAIDRPSGCAFHPRCPHAMAVCREEPGPPAIVIDGVRTWCHLHGEAGRTARIATAALGD